MPQIRLYYEPLPLLSYIFPMRSSRFLHREEISAHVSPISLPDCSLHCNRFLRYEYSRLPRYLTVSKRRWKLRKYQALKRRLLSSLFSRDEYNARTETKILLNVVPRRINYLDSSHSPFVTLFSSLECRISTSTLENVSRSTYNAAI